MTRFAIALFLCSGLACSGFDVVYSDPASVDLSWAPPSGDVAFIRVSGQKELISYNSGHSGPRVSMLPALRDPDTGRWTPAFGGLPQAYLDLAATEASQDAVSQASKSPSLKQAENRLIEFLRTEGAIAAGAVLASADEIDAMVANWEATLNDAQLEKKSAKYDRLLRAVERRGGTESGARYH